MKIDILGVPIDDIGVEEGVDLIKKEIGRWRQVFIATPNPEMIVLAQRDKEFLHILQSASLNLPDGIGLRVGARIFGKKLQNIITGADFMNELMGLGKVLRYSSYFLGGRDGVGIGSAEHFQKKTNSYITAKEWGDFSKWNNDTVLAEINNSGAQMLFVALGHGRQEKWIYENLSKMPGIKIAIGVGGAFDFYSGKIKRAPSWMRHVGFEWLYRLIQEPKRWKRIATAVVIFPALCFKNKFK